MTRARMVTQLRKYSIIDVQAAKEVAMVWLEQAQQNPQYVAVIREELPTWLGKEAEQVLTLNCAPIDAQHMLF